MRSLLAAWRSRYCPDWYGEVARVAVSAGDDLGGACDTSASQDKPGGQVGAGPAHDDV